MSSIEFDGQTLLLEDGESVLESLIRHHIEVRYGCRSGVCQSCLMIAESGDIPDSAQDGLTGNQKELRYMLPCICRPTSPLKLRKISADAVSFNAKVIDKAWMNDRVMRIRLASDEPFRAGQHINILKNGMIGRCYSIASTPAQGYKELHVKIENGGEVSPWLCHDILVGDTLVVQNPTGLCFYRAGKKQPLLLACLSTGLAPVLGVLRDAIEQEHEGPIELVIGNRECSGFYMVDELMALQQQFKQLHITFLAQNNKSRFAREADIYQYCKENFNVLSEFRVFLCGAESFVTKMRRICFLNGASIGNISADSFIRYKP